MPDQPDDAPKRQQRGVLPPFFVPRKGRADGPPTPPSGSWRRLSRLFTPPEGARQHGAAATPAKPFTPPSTPAARPIETAGAPVDTDSLPTRETRTRPSTPVAPPAVTPVASSVVAPVATPSATPVATPVAPSFPFDFTEPAEPHSFDDIAWPTSGDSAGAVDAEPSPEVELAAFAGEGDGELVVESLEQEQISLAMPDFATAGTEAGIQPLEGDVFPDSLSPQARAEVDQGMLAETKLELELERPLLPEDGSWGGGAASSPDARSDLAVPPEGIAASFDEPLTTSAGAAPVESDPWADIELSEPAFGTSGWPPAGAGVDVPEEWNAGAGDFEPASMAGGEVTAGDSGPGGAVVAGEGEDEMTAALGWSDTADTRDAAEAPGDPDEFAVRGEDTFSSVAHELRDSSSAWGSAGDADAIGGYDSRDRVGASEGDVRASSDSPRGDSAPDGEAATVEVPGVSAAIADALARVAERIRAGEVELSKEAAGASDESALAAALAALLRGPRRD